MLYFATAQAADLDMTAFTVHTNPDGTQDYPLSLQVIILMTLLTFLPSIVSMMTSFTRIVIVLPILRQARGLQTSQSNPNHHRSGFIPYALFPEKALAAAVEPDWGDANKRRVARLLAKDVRFILKQQQLLEWDWMC